jgi:hypothetical protein
LDYSYPLQTGIPTFFRFDHVINFPSSAGAYREETAPHVVQLSVSYLARLGSMWGYRGHQGLILIAFGLAPGIALTDKHVCSPGWH